MVFGIHKNSQAREFHNITRAVLREAGDDGTFSGILTCSRVLTVYGCPSLDKSHRIRTCAKWARNSFAMNTSKTKHLKPFGMNTYKKTGGRGAAFCNGYSFAL